MGMRHTRVHQSSTEAVAAVLREFAQVSLLAVTASFDEAMSSLLDRIVAVAGARRGALLLEGGGEHAHVHTDTGPPVQSGEARCLALRDMTEMEARLRAAEPREDGRTPPRWIRQSIRLEGSPAAAGEAIVILEPSVVQTEKEESERPSAQSADLVAALAETAGAVITAGLMAERARITAAAADRRDELVRELREAQADWEQTFDAVSDPLSVVTTDYRVVRANAAYIRTFGLDARNFGKHHCFRLEPGQDAPCIGCPLPQTVETGRPGSVQQVRFPAAGQESDYRVHQCWTYPITNAAGKVDRVVEIVKDVTEQEHLRQAMSQAEALREADRLKAELLGTVSHELRSPLTSIKGYAATLLRHERRLPREERHEFLVAITEASDRLEVIIDRLLEMSQLATGVMAIDRTAVDMQRLAADALSAARQRAAAASPDQFTFTLRADEVAGPQQGAPMLAEVDPRYMREVLDNLLENAVKYSPNGGAVEVILRQVRPAEEHARVQDPATGLAPDVPPGLLAESAAALHRPSLEIIVRDTGVGIPPEHLGRIFEQFHQVDTRLTREVDGLGLGLALCQRIVELHNGRIWAESSPGDGSAFHVLLPLPNWTGDTSESSSMKG